MPDINRYVGTKDTQPIDGTKKLNSVDHMIMLENATDTSHVPFKLTANPTLGTCNLDSSFDGVSGQLLHEQHALVYNDTGSLLPNGKVVRKTGIFQTFATVTLAIANEVTGIVDELGMTTMDIPDGEFGIITTFGKVNDVNTGACVLAARIYISPTIAGNVTDIKPVFPNYAVSLGFVAKVGTTDGQIILQIAGRVTDTFFNVFNGSFRETIKLFVSSDGVTTTASLSPGNGQPNLTQVFRSGEEILFTTPPITKTLTDGTEATPQRNYIYKLESDKLNTDFQVSTSGFPNAEHIKMGFVVLKEVTATQTEGAYVNQNWNDHVQDDDINMGHLLHITERMRQDLPKWDSGAAGTLTIDSVPTPDDVFFSVTSGFVYQIHKQSYPALDMETGDDLHVLNDFTAPNKTITNINGEILDALGNALSNRAFSFVFGGVINRTGQTSHIWMNKPIGSYQKNATATAILDPTGLSVYDIPDFFKSTGFLIGRATLTLDAGGNVWTLESFEDLRGIQPNTTAGGGGGGGTGVTTYLQLSDTDNSYLQKAGQIPTVNDVGGGDGDQLVFDSYLQNQRSSVTIDLTAGDHTLVDEELTTKLLIVSGVTLGNAIIAPAAVADEYIEYTIDNRDTTNPVKIKITSGQGVDIPADTTAKVDYNDKVGIAGYDVIDSLENSWSGLKNYNWEDLDISWKRTNFVRRF